MKSSQSFLLRKVGLLFLLLLSNMSAEDVFQQFKNVFSDPAQYKQSKYLKDLNKYLSSPDFFSSTESSPLNSLIQVEKEISKFSIPEDPSLATLVINAKSKILVRLLNLWNNKPEWQTKESAVLISECAEKFTTEILSRKIENFVPYKTAINVMPPSGAAGMAPEEISDPKERAKYQSDIDLNSRNSIINIQQRIITENKSLIDTSLKEFQSIVSEKHLL